MVETRLIFLFDGGDIMLSESNIVDASILLKILGPIMISFYTVNMLCFINVNFTLQILVGCKLHKSMSYTDRYELVTSALNF